MTQQEMENRIRDLEDIVQAKVLDDVINLNGRRYTNAGKSVQNTDFVTKRELDEVATRIPKEPDPPAEAILTTGKRYPKVVITGKDGVLFYDSTGTLVAQMSGGESNLVDAATGLFTDLSVANDINMTASDGAILAVGGAGENVKITFDTSGARSLIINIDTTDMVTIDANGFRLNSGTMRFGTHNAIGAETVTGYITINDSGGTSRKLAVVS